ncbi:MAG: DUF885 family protein [Planctomycetota bacterium]
MRMSPIASAPLIALALFNPAAPAQPTAEPMVPSAAVGFSAGADLRDLIELYQSDESYISQFRRAAWSEERLDRLDQFYKEWAERVAKLQFSGLSQAGKIDAILLRNLVENQQARMALQRRNLATMEPLMPFRKTIQQLDAKRRRLEPYDPAASAAVLAALPDQIKGVREKIEKARAAKDAPPADGIVVSPVLAQRTARALDEIREGVEAWQRYHEGFKPEFNWWMKDSLGGATKSLREYAEYLRREVAGLKGQPDDPLIGDPIGREALLADIRGEQMVYSPEQLIAIANEEFAWCESEMKKASNAMGLGDDWKAALAKVKEDHVPPGMQDEFVRDESRAAIKYLKDNDLITIPPLCEESWRIEMHTPDQQRYYPFAVYGGQFMGVSYPTDGMSLDDKMMSLRGNNRHFTHNVTPHELIPGHHLQGYMADRVRSYRRPFATPFLVEGWALYWEMRMYEKGWPGATGLDPAMDKVGILFWRMHRCARIIVSLKFHLGEMSPQEMINFLVERVGHEKSGATSEVRRFIGGDYSPLYQCGYMVGGLAVRSLQRELVETGVAGKKLTDKQFHDTVLTYNSIPIEMIRAGMVNAPLAPDTRATWKFAGER